MVSSTNHVSTDGYVRWTAVVRSVGRGKKTFYHLRQPLLVFEPITVPPSLECGERKRGLPKDNFVSRWKRILYSGRL